MDDRSSYEGRSEFAREGSLEDLGAASKAAGPLLYTVAQAALRLGCSESFLERGTAARSIPHRRIGRYVRFSEDDLNAIVEQVATPPVPRPSIRQIRAAQRAGRR